MAKEFTADLCLLFMTDEASDHPKLKASENAGSNPLDLPPESLSTLANRTREIEGIEVFEGGEAQSLLPWTDDSLQLAVVPIVMDGNDRVGTRLPGDRVELRAIPGQRFKGIGHDVTVYEVEGLREELF